jgi:uncharacterized membrane protein HdeD (DUF308 family)
MNSLVGQRLWRWQRVAGLLTIVLGAIVLAWPVPTILVASTLLGVYLLLSGLAGQVMAFTLPRSAATGVLPFLSGAPSVVLASLTFRQFGEAYTVLLLSLWIGISFIFQGISGVAAGIGESNQPGRGGHVVAGIWLVINGITRVIEVIQTRKAANTARQTVDRRSNRLAAALND